MNKPIEIPELSLVLLIGVSGSGKSTFARKHFLSTEVISSDYCRALVADDENDLRSTPEAFEVLRFIAAKRLKAGRLTVIDATNVQVEARRTLIELARQYHVLPVAIVLDMPVKLCQERNQLRPDRDFGPHVILNQHKQLHHSLSSLKKKEHLTQVHVLRSLEEVESATIERKPVWNNKKHENGPFDIVGDVHGCFDELMLLLAELGYSVEKTDRYSVTHPEKRRLVFVGDLVDRGPNSPEVLRLVMDAVVAGQAFCVVGNHDDKLKRKLMGRDVKVAHGLQETLDQLQNEPPEFTASVLEFLQGLISHYVFDEGRLAVAHAGLKEHYIGRGSPRIRDFCMYGDTTGEIDEFGLPVRYPWANDYRGNTLIVYGHTPIPEAQWLNNTVNIDTGCVFGGKLTALRYPEKQLVSVDSARVYCEPVRPLHSDRRTGGDTLLDVEDVMGKRIIRTQIHHNVTIREDQATAALEVMSRFALDPRWLIYLPPTMSPTEACPEGPWLERPEQAFAFYRSQGVRQLICQEKHMGSRAILVLCRNSETARRRFGVSGEAIGACYTRTGRSFFNDQDLERAFLTRVQQAVERSGLWDELKTDWICLDAELMPWSAKAQGLLDKQYAPVGAAALAALPEAARLLEQASSRAVEGVEELRDRFRSRLARTTAYREAYRRYCWPVQDIGDYRLAPFHILAHENGFNLKEDHSWHLRYIDALCDADPELFRKTARRLVDAEDEADSAEAVSWWEAMTDAGGEGMVVKPLAFTVTTEKGLLQPGVKCRGREYLRIIYGPEYDAPENLERLRARSVNGKRSLALREYALGYEALNHFVSYGPLHKVHEAVFGVLALETEPVDPAL